MAIIKQMAKIIKTYERERERERGLYLYIGKSKPKACMRKIPLKNIILM